MEVVVAEEDGGVEEEADRSRGDIEVCALWFQRFSEAFGCVFACSIIMGGVVMRYDLEHASGSLMKSEGEVVSELQALETQRKWEVRF
jgi:hypothetical protein